MLHFTSDFYKLRRNVNLPAPEDDSFICRLVYFISYRLKQNVLYNFLFKNL